MSDPHKSTDLLSGVAQRLRLVALGKLTYRCLLAVSGVYLAVLLTSRLLGVIPDWFDLQGLLVIPFSAVLLALVLHRRPTLVDAARRVDQHSRTKDLYLTVALLDDSPGEFKPLVLQEAEHQATQIKPLDVVPIGPGRRVAHAALAMVVLMAGIFYLPQLDPFGRVEAAQQETLQKRELEKARKDARRQIARLKKEASAGELSEDVKKAVEELKLSLKKTKPGQKKANANMLARNQKGLGQKWRKINAQKLMDVLARSNVTQRFGRAASQGKLEKWSKQLQQGESDSLNKEMQELKAELKDLLSTKDPVKKAELMQKLKRKLKDLEDFATNRAGSKPLQASLKRALKQLEMSKFEGMHDEALKAALESVDLAKLQLNEIAQSAKDLQELEQALKVAQMAKRVNDKGELDGAACENCLTLEDYADLFAELGGLGLSDDMAEGTGERGQGGGMVDEDDSIQTDFKTEQSKSSIQAGKVLLSLKTKGMSDSGDAKKDYRNLVRNIRQGVSEAIQTEKIPPGYHEGIKAYFDNIDDALERSDATDE